MRRVKIDPLTSGDELEARVALVWFWEGYYTRAGVDLADYYGAELLQVTDLDLIAYSFGPSLETRLVIGESKSGTGKSAPKPLDRIVWLSGLQRLVDADAAELTISSAAVARSRDLGRRLGVAVQSPADLTAREQAVDTKEVANAGAHGAAAMQLRKTVAKIVRDHVTLQPASRFLTSEVWLLDEFSAFKQCIGTLMRLKELWTPEARDDEALAARWLIGEALSVMVFNLVRISAHSRPMSPESFSNFVRERLADGVVPAAKMRQLSRDIDKFISGLLAAADAPSTLRIDALGAFDPEPPEWADSLVELALRVRAMDNARDLPRLFDVVVHERIARVRTIPDHVVRRLSLDSDVLGGAIAVIAAFLRNFDALPQDLSDVLTAPISRSEAEADSLPPTSGALFELAGFDESGGSDQKAGPGVNADH